MSATTRRGGIGSFSGLMYGFIYRGASGADWPSAGLDDHPPMCGNDFVPGEADGVAAATLHVSTRELRKPAFVIALLNMLCWRCLHLAGYDFVQRKLECEVPPHLFPLESFFSRVGHPQQLELVINRIAYCQNPELHNVEF